MRTAALSAVASTLALVWPMTVWVLQLFTPIPSTTEMGIDTSKMPATTLIE